MKKAKRRLQEKKKAENGKKTTKRLHQYKRRHWQSSTKSSGVSHYLSYQMHTKYHLVRTDHVGYT